MPGGAAQATGRKLFVDHCTARGQGFLDLVKFLVPLAAARLRCAVALVLADGLVGWEPGKRPGGPSVPRLFVERRREPVRCTRQGVGRAQPRRQRRPSRWSATNLVSWQKSVPRPTHLVPVKFQNETAATPQPQDFAVQGNGQGANPKNIGPAAPAANERLAGLAPSLVAQQMPARVENPRQAVLRRGRRRRGLRLEVARFAWQNGIRPRRGET